MDEFEFTLDWPLTEEQWDVLEDADLDQTNSITFYTKHGKEVRFVKDTNVRSNGDYLRSLSDEELVNYIECKQFHNISNCYKMESCRQCILNWLKQARIP